jgi:hypothetical protein
VGQRQPLRSVRQYENVWERTAKEEIDRDRTNAYPCALPRALVMTTTS